MKPLPEIKNSYKDLFNVLYAPIRSKLLMTGIELKVFDHLAEPASAEAVAQRIGTHPGNTGVLLDGLASMDLLEKKKNLYRNTPVAQEFLLENTASYLGGTFLFTSNMFVQSGLENMQELVKNGPPAMPAKDVSSEEMWAHCARTGANYQRGGMAQRVAEIVRNLPEFPTFGKMLDLGCGAGLYGIAIVADHPDMKGVLFDRPEVVGVARDFVDEYEMQDRMAVMAGDYLQDPIGEGYDLVWASNTLNFAKHDIDSVMGKIHEALNPGGVFVSLSDGLTDEGTKPPEMLLGMILIAMSGWNMSFDQGFLADSMQRVGFETVRSRTLDILWGHMELDVARKSKRSLS
jgi:hypothetical protein